jgi:hypothetical protein
MSWIMTVANIRRPLGRADGTLAKPSRQPAHDQRAAAGGRVFRDMTPRHSIFTPIQLPVVRQLGLSDIHFGIILMPTSATAFSPPVGTCLSSAAARKDDIAR